VSTPVFLKRPREILSPAEKRQLTAGFGTPIRSAPKRSRWKPLLVIAALLAGAVALGMLTGCAEDRGPQWIGDPLTLPDGSKIAAFDVLSRPDRLGLGQVDGVGLMQVDAGGHAAIVGWSTTQGQSAAGMIAQAAVSGATGLAGSGIVGGLTKQGLSTVSSAISSMKPPAVQVDLPKSAAGF
jgi:hypothetical protein